MEEVNRASEQLGKSQIAKNDIKKLKKVMSPPIKIKTIMSALHAFKFDFPVDWVTWNMTKTGPLFEG